MSYDRCIELPLHQNCLVVEVDAGDKPVGCRICRPGYYLNFDNVCETLNPSQCLTANPEPVRVPQPLLPMLLQLSYDDDSVGGGCQDCRADRVPVRRPFHSCVYSTYNRQSNKATYTVYFDNCVKYTLNGTADSGFVLKCRECAPGYVLTMDLKKCLLFSETGTPALRNCVLSSTDGSACMACADGFYVAQGACSVLFIENCEAYKFVAGSPPSCAKCLPFFALVGGRCAVGSIPNCLTYTAESLTACEQCAVGFQLLTRSDGTFSCLLITNYPFCASLDVPSFKERKLKCNKCFYGQPNSVAGGDVSSLCTYVPVAPNCASIDLSGIDSPNFAKCLSCNAGYFLNAIGGCSKTTVVSNCTAYSPTEDLCVACQQSFYLGRTGTSSVCTPNPVGVPNCVDYSSLTTCGVCATDYYLSENRCVKVTKKLIDCVVYQSETVCAVCADETVKINSLLNCQRIEVADCRVGKSLRECVECKAGKFLKENVCVNMLQNCLKYEKDRCVECSNLKAPKLDSCVEIPPII